MEEAWSAGAVGRRAEGVRAEVKAVAETEVVEAEAVEGMAASTGAQWVEMGIAAAGLVADPWGGVGDEVDRSGSTRCTRIPLG